MPRSVTETSPLLPDTIPCVATAGATGAGTHRSQRSGSGCCGGNPVRSWDESPACPRDGSPAHPWVTLAALPPPPAVPAQLSDQGVSRGLQRRCSCPRRMFPRCFPDPQPRRKLSGSGEIPPRPGPVTEGGSGPPGHIHRAGQGWEKTIYCRLRHKPQVESRGTAHADTKLSSFVKLSCSLSTCQEESRIYL